MIERYAQEISDTTAGIIGYAVLVTDRDGNIIGSSDPARMGQLLNEVPEVVRTRKGYIVYKDEADRVENTRMGVTYPVQDPEGRIVGTIAITGDPEKVDPFAMIVQKQAEMYLRERSLLETAFFRKRTAQAFLKDVLSFDPRVTDSKILEKKAREFGYNSNNRYVAIYVSFGLASVERSIEEESLLDRLVLSLVSKVFTDLNDLSVLVEKEGFFIFYAVSDDTLEDREIYEQIRGKCAELKVQMSACGLSPFFGVGAVVSDISGWSRSAEEAREVQKQGRFLYPERDMFIISDFRLYQLMSSARKDLGRVFCRESLELLDCQTDSEDLKRTVEKWCQYDLSVKDAAEALYIHRNTLHYRLEKLEKILGFSMKNFTRLMELYLAIQIEKMNSADSIDQSPKK